MQFEVFVPVVGFSTPSHQPCCQLEVFAISFPSRKTLSCPCLPLTSFVISRKISVSWVTVYFLFISQKCFYSLHHNTNATEHNRFSTNTIIQLKHIEYLPPITPSYHTNEAHVFTIMKKKRRRKAPRNIDMHKERVRENFFVFYAMYFFFFSQR